MKHPLFISRTVLVKNNKVEEAVSILNKILGREGVLSDARRIQYYEKPWQVSETYFKAAAAVIESHAEQHMTEAAVKASFRFGLISMTRRRICFIRARAICSEEMDRKIKFLMRKNRVEPYPGCY